MISLVFSLALFVTLTWTTGAQNTPNDCEFEFHVKQGHHLFMDLMNFTKTSGKRHKLCNIRIRADIGTRIVMDLFYLPKKPTTESSSCMSDYVHVGNDVRRVDVHLMTSYKFCHRKATYELVSRDNEMWFVYKASTSKPKDLSLKIQAKEPVTCSPDQFTCSPVQCVDNTKTCDGTRDCSNGHDEYCVSSTGYVEDHAHNMEEESESCFRCLDGTCIAPRLPRYSIGWGRVYWYLCDGFSHCADGWDERPEICSMLLKGRVGSVTECVPFDRHYGPNRKVIMWNDIRCDDVTDCFHAEDEIRCHKHGQNARRLHAKPVTIAIIATVIGLFTIVGLFIWRLQHRGRTGFRPSMTSAAETFCTQCTSCDGDQHRSGSCCSATLATSGFADANSDNGGIHHGNTIEMGTKPRNLKRKSDSYEKANDNTTESGVDSINITSNATATTTATATATATATTNGKEKTSLEKKF